MALVAELEFLRGLVLHCVGHVIAAAAAAAVVVVVLVVLVVVAVAGFPLVPLVGLDLDAVNRWFSFASCAKYSTAALWYASTLSFSFCFFLPFFLSSDFFAFLDVTLSGLF